MEWVIIIRIGINGMFLYFDCLSYLAVKIVRGVTCNWLMSAEECVLTYVPTADVLWAWYELSVLCRLCRSSQHHKFIIRKYTRTWAREEFGRFYLRVCIWFQGFVRENCTNGIYLWWWFYRKRGVNIYFSQIESKRPFAIL